MNKQYPDWQSLAKDSEMRNELKLKDFWEFYDGFMACTCNKRRKSLVKYLIGYFEQYKKSLNQNE